jgi:hypothetical protein
MEKKRWEIPWPHCSSQGGHYQTGVCIPSWVSLWTEEALLQRVPKRGTAWRQPHPIQDPTLSAKVTTGGLSAPVFRRWSDTSYGLMGPGPSIQASLLSINVEEPQVAIMVEKWQVIFLLDSGAHFSVLPFSPGPRSNEKVYLASL